MTFRTLAGWIDQLPPESRTKTALRDQMHPAELTRLSQGGPGEWSGYGPWSREALMLAEVKDVLERVIYALVRVNGGKMRAPDPYPRPGVAPKGVQVEADPRAVSYLADLRRRHQQQQ